MKIRKSELTILSICHLLVDGVCAAALLRDLSVPQLSAAILLYNTCAFTTQCLTGMIPDRFGRARLFTLLSAVILAAGALLPMTIIPRAVVLGLGNSLFHVCGGYLTMRGSRTMGPLGVFVAPGAIGLFLGTSFPVLRLPFVLMLLALSVLELRQSRDETGLSMKGMHPAHEHAAAADGNRSATGIASAALTENLVTERSPAASPIPKAALYAGLLLVAVAARAVGGSAIVFPWKTGFFTGAALTAAVFLGKTCGGFAADRLGLQKTAVFSVLAASLLLILFPGSMVLSLIGQFALNLSMPITLWLVWQLYPDNPGFAFGLAAAALWPGTLAGKLIHLTGVWAGLLTFVCFAAGLAAVIITEKALHGEKHSKT